MLARSFSSRESILSVFHLKGGSSGSQFLLMVREDSWFYSLPRGARGRQFLGAFLELKDCSVWFVLLGCSRTVQKVFFIVFRNLFGSDALFFLEWAIVFWGRCLRVEV